MRTGSRPVRSRAVTRLVRSRPLPLKPIFLRSPGPRIAVAPRPARSQQDRLWLMRSRHEGRASICSTLALVLAGAGCSSPAARSCARSSTARRGSFRRAGAILSTRSSGSASSPPSARSPGTRAMTCTGTPTTGCSAASSTQPATCSATTRRSRRTRIHTARSRGCRPSSRPSRSRARAPIRGRSTRWYGTTTSTGARPRTVHETARREDPTRGVPRRSRRLRDPLVHALGRVGSRDVHRTVRNHAPTSSA
jgi:hypothetical protein